MQITPDRNGSQDQRPQPIIDANIARDREMLADLNYDFNASYRDQFDSEPDADLPLLRLGQGDFRRDYDGGEPWQRPIDFLCGIIAGACLVGCAWIISGVL